MNRIKITVLCASSAMAIAASPVVAQDNTADIIVTARRVEERLQDVPISITVFNQQTLTNRNVVSAGDIATYTPSLSANGRYGAENTSFAIRGMVQDQGTAPSVAVYFADVATLRAAGGTTVGNGAGPGSFFDLANVQVLKGAQGTLFGRNTTGGAVLLVPQKPTGKFEGYVEGSIGNYDMKRIQAVVNVPVMDTLRIRVGVDRQTRTGYLHNYSPIGPRDFADTDYTAVRFSAVADLTPNLENYFIATYSNSDTSGYLPQVFTCAPGLYPNIPANAGAINTAKAGCAQVARGKATGDYYAVENGTQSPRQRIEQWQLINTTTWKATDNLTIKNVMSYGQFKEIFRASVYGEYLIIPDGANAGQPLLKVQTSPPPGLQSAAESTFTEELQFQGTALNNRLNWQAGLYTEQSEPLGFSGSSSISTGVCYTANNFQCVAGGSPTLGGTSLINERLNHQRFQDYGIFGQGTYKLTDQLSFTGGFRYTWDATTAITKQDVYLLSATSGVYTQRCVVTGTVPATNGCVLPPIHNSSNAPTWLVDLDYKPTDDMLLYAKYSRGYRAAGIKVDGGPDFNTFKAEKVDNYEVGLKTSFDGAVMGTFNVAAFYTKFLSQQLAARLDPTAINPNQQPPSVIASGARSRIYGVEVEASVSPFSGLRIDGNYAYLNTKLQSVPPQDGSSTLYYAPVTVISTPGSQLGYAPKNKFTVTGTYTLPLDDSIGKISVSGTYSHSDSQITTVGYIIPVSIANSTIPSTLVGDPGRIQAINLVNANVNWTNVVGRPVDLGFFMTNLTNEKYVNAVFGGISAFGFDAQALGEPRMYGFRLKYHW